MRALIGIFFLTLWLSLIHLEAAFCSGSNIEIPVSAQGITSAQWSENSRSFALIDRKKQLVVVPDIGKKKTWSRTIGSGRAGKGEAIFSENLRWSPQSQALIATYIDPPKNILRIVTLRGLDGHLLGTFEIDLPSPRYKQPVVPSSSGAVFSASGQFLAVSYNTGKEGDETFLWIVDTKQNKVVKAFPAAPKIANWAWAGEQFITLLTNAEKTSQWIESWSVSSGRTPLKIDAQKGEIDEVTTNHEGVVFVLQRRGKWNWQAGKEQTDEVLTLSVFQYSANAWKLDWSQEFKPNPRGVAGTEFITPSSGQWAAVLVPLGTDGISDRHFWLVSKDKVLRPNMILKLHENLVNADPLFWAGNRLIFMETITPFQVTNTDKLPTPQYRFFQYDVNTNKLTFLKSAGMDSIDNGWPSPKWERIAFLRKSDNKTVLLFKAFLPEFAPKTINTPYYITVSKYPLITAIFCNHASQPGALSFSGVANPAA